jgi:hypothetical protein
VSDKSTNSPSVGSAQLAADEDAHFAARYGAALKAGDYVHMAHALSGQLRRMEKRAAAANARADSADKALRKRRYVMGENGTIHLMQCERCAVAPDLLTALKALGPHVNQDGSSEQADLLNWVDDVIARAEGR